MGCSDYLQNLRVLVRRVATPSLYVKKICCSPLRPCQGRPLFGVVLACCKRVGEGLYTNGLSSNQGRFKISPTPYYAYRLADVDEDTSSLHPDWLTKRKMGFLS